jgi:hypothetical protein
MDSDDEVDNPIGEDVSAPTRARAPPFRFLPPCFCDGSPSAQRGAATAVFLLLGLVVSPHPLSSTERLAHAHVSPSSPALAPLSCLSAQGLTDYERKRAIRIAQNEAMLLSLGLSALSAKVGGNDNGSGGGSALSPGARAPGTCAPIKRRDRALVEKPRPFRIVLRQRVTKVNYGEEEDTETKKPRHKVPRLTEPSSYSALGTRRATFQVPRHLTAVTNPAGGATAATPAGGGAAAASSADGVGYPQFATLDDKYAADPEAARRAMTMAVSNTPHGTVPRATPSPPFTFRRTRLRDTPAPAPVCPAPLTSENAYPVGVDAQLCFCLIFP